MRTGCGVLDIPLFAGYDGKRKAPDPGYSPGVIRDYLAAGACRWKPPSIFP
jgi:hypothetical protein